MKEHRRSEANSCLIPPQRWAIVILVISFDSLLKKSPLVKRFQALCGHSDGRPSRNDPMRIVIMEERTSVTGSCAIDLQ
jgi:hypothetical protein